MHTTLFSTLKLWKCMTKLSFNCDFWKSKPWPWFFVPTVFSFLFLQVIKSISLGFEVQVFAVTPNLKLCNSFSDISWFWSESLTVIDFNFQKLSKFWLFSTFTLIIFWGIEPHQLNFSFWTLQWRGGGGGDYGAKAGIGP